MTTAPLPQDLGLPQRAGADDVKKTLGLGKGRHGRRALRVALLALCVIAAVALAVRYYITRAASSVPKYEMAAIGAAELRVTVTATGRVEGLNTVEVGAEVSGRMLRVSADYNDRVSKGQVLAEIDPEQLRAAVNQGKAQAASARAAIAEARATQAQTRAAAARAHAMHAEGLISKQDIETADASAARADASLANALAGASLAQATLAQAQYKLDRAVIISPIDGIVLARLVEPGQTVTAGFQTPILFKLAEDLTQMTLHVDIDEADIGRVREGQQASFTVDAYAERTFPSRVQSLRNEPKVSQNVVTYEGVLAVDNAERLLRPGMTAMATIVVATKHDVLLVPNAALRFTPSDAGRKPGQALPEERPGERRVWVLDAGKPKAVALRVGASDGRMTEVVEGDVRPGAQVIIGREED